VIGGSVGRLGKEQDDAGEGHREQSKDDEARAGKDLPHLDPEARHELGGM
jgi:hypothetical protein